jgi:uncharacterized Rmd1/YagE family protein
MVGRVEVGEKPAMTWDEPELDRLYERLAQEFELPDRDRALTRKLEVISDVAGTYLELLDTRKSHRLEWYIVILIVAEIVAWELPRVRALDAAAARSTMPSSSPPNTCRRLVP